MNENTTFDLAALRRKLTEGTEVLRTGGGASVTAGECHVILDALSGIENASGLLRELSSVKEALRDLAAYGPLEGTRRWNEMDSGHRRVLSRARGLLPAPVSSGDA